MGRSTFPAKMIVHSLLIFILLSIIWQPAMGTSTTNGSLVLDTKTPTAMGTNTTNRSLVLDTRTPVMTFEGGKL
jgi:hypothetical protein